MDGNYLMEDAVIDAMDSTERTSSMIENKYEHFTHIPAYPVLDHARYLIFAGKNFTTKFLTPFFSVPT